MIDFTTNPLVRRGVFDPARQSDKTQPMRVTFFPDGIREIKDSDRCGLPVFLDRIQTPQEAEGLRLLYRRIARRCMKGTSSARTNILQLPHYVSAGRPAYIITGFVSGVHFAPGGVLDRICLTGPRAVDPDTGEAFDVDTHIWLFVDKATIADPSLIRDHAGLGGATCSPFRWGTASPCTAISTPMRKARANASASTNGSPSTRSCTTPTATACSDASPTTSKADWRS